MPKLTEITNIATTAVEDELYMVDDPGGTPLSRAVTLGELLPQYTTAGMNAISTPTGGMLIYNTDEDAPFYYNATDADWLSVIDGLPE
jgi:hypothetical protein